MAGHLTPKTFDGHNIQDGTIYESKFVEPRGGFEAHQNPPSEPVETEREGQYPEFVRTQPVAYDIDLEINVLTNTQANVETLKAWFNTYEGPRFLVVTDEADVERRIQVTVSTFVPIISQAAAWHAVLHVVSPFWETAAEVTVTENVVATGETFTVDNEGIGPVPFTLTIEPNAVSSTRQTKSRRVYLANRSTYALSHFASKGYPIDLTDGGMDTSSTSDFMANLNDLRVYQYGEDKPRWTSPATRNASTKVFSNIFMAPGKFATLASDIDGSATSFTVDNPDGFARDHWPSSGWLFIGTEPFLFTNRTRFGSGTLTRPHPTSHSAGDTVTWIEHVLDLVYDDADAADPPSHWDDTEPVLDLTASTNTSHKLASNFFSDSELRAATLERRIAADGSQFVRCYTDDDGKLRWEDREAESGKPALPRTFWHFPVPLTSLTLDYEVEQTMLLELFGSDGQTRHNLLQKVWTDGELTSQVVTPDQGIYSLELSARIAAINGILHTESFSPNLFDSTPRTAVKRVDNPFFNQILDQWKRIHEDVDNKAYERGFSVAYYGGDRQVPSGLISHRTMNISMPPFIRFRVDDTGPITGFVVYSSDWNTLNIYNSLGGIPGEWVTSASTSGSGSGYKFYRTLIVGDNPTALAAGEYFAKPGGSFGVVGGKLHPDISFGWHDVFNDRTQVQIFTFTDFYDFPEPEPEEESQFDAYYGGSASGGGHDIEWDEYAEVVVETEPQWHDEFYLTTPVFAVISADLPLGPNAPTDTGFKVTVDNLIATLDSTKSPLILVDSAIDVFLGDLNLVFGSGSDAQEMDVHLLMPLDETLTIDTGELTAVLSETGLPASWAVAYSNSPLGTTLPVGETTITVNLPGVQDLDLTVTFRPQLG